MVPAKKYLEWYRNIPHASEHFQRLTDLLIKLVDAHKARDALIETIPSAEERFDVRFLLEEGLRHLKLAEHFFYRAYENDDLIREERFLQTRKD